MTMSILDRTAAATQLTEYVRSHFVGEFAIDQFDARTPLLRWGLLTSLNITQLIAYIRAEFLIEIPFTALVSSNFTDIESIVDLLVRLDLDRSDGNNAR